MITILATLAVTTPLGYLAGRLHSRRIQRKQTILRRLQPIEVFELGADRRRFS